MKLKRHEYYIDLCLEYINLHFEVTNPKKMQSHLQKMLLAVISMDLDKDLRNLELDYLDKYKDKELDLDDYIDNIILSSYLKLYRGETSSKSL